MDLKELKKDLSGLKSQKEQLIAQINAVSGAIQYIEEKIRELEKKKFIKIKKEEIKNG